ncbi:MAG: hypothetical protein ACXAEF_04005 [Candidatus Thorarchaeota archaeon]
MEENRKLLILKEEEPLKGRRLGFKIDRRKALKAISSSGAKVIHDSGGRLIVIEVPEEAEEKLDELLPEVRIESVDSDVRDSITDLDSTESLFLEALKIRTSKSYREAKKLRKVGDTPEERDLVSGPCIREEY